MNDLTANVLVLVSGATMPQMFTALLFRLIISVPSPLVNDLFVYSFSQSHGKQVFKVTRFLPTKGGAKYDMKSAIKSPSSMNLISISDPMPSGVSKAPWYPQITSNMPEIGYLALFWACVRLYSKVCVYTEDRISHLPAVVLSLNQP